MTKRMLVLLLLSACYDPSLSAGGLFFGHRRFATRQQGAYHARPAAAQSTQTAPRSVQTNLLEELRSQTIGGLKIDDMLDPYMRARNTPFR